MEIPNENDSHRAKSFMMMNSSVTMNQTIATKPQPITTDRAVPPSKIKSAPVPAAIKRKAAQSAAPRMSKMRVSMSAPVSQCPCIVGHGLHLVN